MTFVIGRQTGSQTDYRRLNVGVSTKKSVSLLIKKRKRKKTKVPSDVCLVDFALGKGMRVLSKTGGQHTHVIVHCDYNQDIIKKTCITLEVLVT